MATQLYLIQNGYIGNVIAWWAKGGAGYTANLVNAETFTKEQARRIVRSNPNLYAWPQQYIHGSQCDKARYTVVDMQYLNHANRRAWRGYGVKKQKP